MAPPPPRVEAATRGDREVPTSTKNTTSKTSSDEGSNDRHAEKRYEERERELVFGVVVTSLSREMGDVVLFFQRVARGRREQKDDDAFFPRSRSRDFCTDALAFSMQ